MTTPSLVYRTLRPLRPHLQWRKTGQNQLYLSIKEAQLSAQLLQRCSSGRMIVMDVSASGPSFVSRQPSLDIIKIDTQKDMSQTSKSDSTPICSLLDLLSLNETSIRLPPLASRVPIVTPPSVPVAPHHLPESESAVTAIVEPYADVEPRLLPTHRSQRHINKQCVNMIILRRKKMKKHKRKKERKRNRVSHEQRILHDIMRREKNFMTVQMSLLREAEAFDAEKHVKDIIDRINNKPIPKYWRGKRLHESTVIKLMHKAGLKVPGIDK